MLLAGKTAVITGGASIRGIGLATARLYAQHGARCAIIDLDAAMAEDAAGSLSGEGHLGLACDVTDKAACEAVIADVQEAFSRIDILANIAGITQPVKTLEITPEDYSRITNVNLGGTLYMSQAVLPIMQAQGGGAIVNMSSVSAQRGGGIFGGPHYSAAKAGVLGLTRAIAREFGPDNIRANAVTPSLIATDITGDVMTPERKAEIAAGIPLGRLGTAEDVAGVFLFLASDLSAYVTGATIDINGGSLIH
ncbi:MAG: SDR family NAD(P)-dependent oxidoreductase [Geminicoccaceae bacterium]